MSMSKKTGWKSRTVSKGVVETTNGVTTVTFRKVGSDILIRDVVVAEGVPPYQYLMETVKFWNARPHWMSDAVHIQNTNDIPKRWEARIPVRGRV